jgi:hypothetical protein
MIGKIPARPSLFLSPSLPLIVPLLRISYTVFYCRPTHRDQVRRGHRRGAAMQRPGVRLRLAVGQCHALMLPQVLDLGLHEEGFDIAGWVGRIMEQLPAQGAVPKAFQAHLPHARAKSPACIISMWYSTVTRTGPCSAGGSMVTAGWGQCKDGVRSSVAPPASR